MSDPSESNIVDKNARVRACWSAFCAREGMAEDTPYQAWYFGSGPQMAHELVELVIQGPKRATTGLQSSIDRNPELAPVPRGYSVVTEYDGTPRAILRTTEIQSRAFKDVDAQYAWDEGEGDRSLADWREGHWKYFSAECASLGLQPSEDMVVVMERFELLWVYAP